jgi:fructose-bisphosphate aldolase/6-deoxy-5-ketofructose 1-phosphate synthase
MKIHIPLTVPQTQEKEYIKNFNTATRGTGKLMMFAGDQKVEHLNSDFVGKGIPSETADPEHYFRIASQAEIGVFAAQLGLLAKYGRDYSKVPYLVKLNSKTNLLTEKHKDPLSERWIPVEDVVKFKKQSGLNIVGVGYTIYIGSWYEAQMFGQAARIIEEAHQHGLITVIWMYPRGKAVADKEENNIHLIAGGAGVALCLGADFVKLNYPYNNMNCPGVAQKFKEVTQAAGRTKVICIGGTKKHEKEFLKCLHGQINISGTQGVAIGRNIYQRPVDEAVRMANAVSAVALYDYSAEDAYDIFLGKKDLRVK